jgi:mono/diheme cytochrome c family protein
MRGYTEARAREPASAANAPAGMRRLLFDDFHGLSTDTLRRSAVPWKVLAAALVMAEAKRAPAGAVVPLTEDEASRILTERYGFLAPTRIGNWPAGVPAPALGRRPLGLVSGTVARTLPPVEMEVVNTGCSTCHTGMLYDAGGNPTFEAWVGLPSTSINLGRYADEVFAAFEDACARPDDLVATIRAMFPAVSAREIATLRKYYLPELEERIPRLARTVGGFTPYSNGSPGLTNGVATMKLYLGALPPDRPAPGEVAFVGVPDFGGLRWKNALLIDGVYSAPGWQHAGEVAAPPSRAERDAIAGVATVVTVGTLGVAPAVAAGPNAARLRDVVDFLDEGYVAPRFPGAIDRDKAAAGAAVYAAQCESCHGRYAAAGDGYRLVEFPNRLVPADVIDTDPVRAAAVTSDVQALFRDTALAARLRARRTGGYVATPLGALWATAPYLHNNSVPTLWHLMHPAERPARFQVGGHKLDFSRMGVAGETAADGAYRYPRGYQPWSLPEVYDTRLPGRSNAGHEQPFDDMSEGDKDVLLEFLKEL